MTATTSTSSSTHPHHHQRFATEPRPPAFLNGGAGKRREDRLKCISSFDEIIESEEEDVQEGTSSSNSSTTSERSPYAVYEPASKEMKTRSFSLQHNPPFLSPRSLRHILPSTARLSRGFSDPGVRRKSSLPTILSTFQTPDGSDEFLSLPPIPEATTPASPSASSPSTNLFKISETDNS